MRWRKARVFTLATVIAASLSVTPAHASTIGGGVVYTCAANDAATCDALNSTLGTLYSSTFTDANANIYIQEGSAGLASTLQYFTNVSYSIYETALVAAEDDANDITAIASLGGSATNPVVGSDGVALSSALATVLGLATQAGSVGIAPSGAACLLGSPGCYNGRITVSDAANTWYFRSGAQPAGTYDFYSAVEHETDEVLGTVSCLVGDNNNASTITTSLNCRNGTPSLAVAAADLFRYGSPGVRSYLTSANGTGAYFSIDGGVTNVAFYNNQPNGEDYGDWTPSPLRVQNAQGTPDKSGFDITNDGGSEIEVLDAVGYNLKTATVPEPGTSGMLALGFVVLGYIGYRRSRGTHGWESPAVTDRVKRLLSAWPVWSGRQPAWLDN